MGRLLRRSAAAMALGVVLLARPAAAADTATEPVRVHVEEVAEDGAVTAVVTTPPTVVGVDLPASAFTVVQDGATVPARVAPLPEGDLEAAMVVGARSTTSLAMTQDALAEFLRGFPEEGTAALVDASGPRTLVPITTDGIDLVDGMLELESAGSSASTTEDAVRLVLDELPGEAARRAVLLMTDDEGAVSPELTDRLREEGASLYYVHTAVETRAVPSLVDAATASGGRAQRGDGRGLIRTTDQVLADLANQYRVTFRGSGAEAAEVRVDLGPEELAGSTSLTVPPPVQTTTAATTAAPVEEEEGGGAGDVVWAATLVAIAVLALVAAGLLLRRHRAGRAPTPPPPVVLDLRGATASVTEPPVSSPERLS